MDATAAVVLPLGLAAPSFGAEIERTTPPAIVEETGPDLAREDPTGFTTVIRTEEFAGENKRVDDMLETVPGVYVRRFGGPGQPAEVSIRGATGSQVVVLLDGVRLNTAQSGTVDLSTISADLIERIEVLRGGGSVQTGSDAIGGVVSIVTRRASARPETGSSGAAGSYETWQGGVSQTGRLGETELLLGYDFFKTSGDWEFEPVSTAVPGASGTVERINNRVEQHSGLLKIARDLGERMRLEFSDSFFYGSEGRPGLDLASGGERRGQRESARQRRTRNAAQVRLGGVDGTPLDLDWNLQLFHRFDRSRFRDPDLVPEGDSDDRNQALGARAEVEGEAETGPVKQRLSLGGELREDRFDPKAAPDHERLVGGVFAQDELSALEDRLRIVPALRLDATQGFDEEWIPRFGVALRITPWLQIRGNVERAYRVPNFDELYLDEGTVRGDPSLRPEDAIDYDLGFELSRASWGAFSGLGLELAGFWNDIDNTIVFQQVSPNVIKATNVPDVRARGIELSGGAAWRWVGISGSYTYLDSEIRRTGNPLPGRPEQEADLRLVLSPLAGAVKLAGSLHYTDEIPVNASGRSVLSARTTYDLSLVLGLAALSDLPGRLGLRALDFSVVATNVTDQAVRDAVGFPQPGRVLTFRLELKR